MPDYDDAESPVDEREAPSRSPRRATGPIAKAMAWFGAQPATTKVIVIGVIVVLGVVIYMAFKKTPAVSATGEETTGPFDTGKGNKDRSLTGSEMPLGIVNGQPIPLGGGFQPGPQPAPPGPIPAQQIQPAVQPPVARWMVTPGGVAGGFQNYSVNNAGHRQGIAITGSLN